MHANDAKITYSTYYATLNGNPAVPELFIIQEDLSVKVQVCLCPPQCQSLQRELVWQQAPTSGVCKAPCSPVMQTETHTEGQAVHPCGTWAGSQMLPGCKVSMTPGLVAPGTKCNRHFCPQSCMPMMCGCLPYQVPRVVGLLLHISLFLYGLRFSFSPSALILHSWARGSVKISINQLTPASVRKMQTTRQQKMLAHKICDAQQSHMQVNLRRKMYKKKKRMESPYLVTILTTTLVYTTCNHFLKNTNRTTIICAILWLLV